MRYKRPRPSSTPRVIMEPPVIAHLPLRTDIDPIAILILCVANGFAGDLLPAASLTGDPDFWSYLVNAPNGLYRRTWLEAAAALGHSERVRFLVHAGASLDPRDDAPLMSPGGAIFWAAFYGHTNNLMFLLDNRNDASTVARDGALAMLTAAQEGRHHTVATLIARGCDVNASDPDMPSPLNAAVRCCRSRLSGADHAATVSLLLARGAIIGRLDSAGYGEDDLPTSTLISAVERGAVDIVKLLLTHEPGLSRDVSIVDSMSALHACASIPRLPNGREIAELLLDAGADIDLRLTITDDTPLSLARAVRNLTVIELLQERGGIE